MLPNYCSFDKLKIKKTRLLASCVSMPLENIMLYDCLPYPETNSKNISKARLYIAEIDYRKMLQHLIKQYTLCIWGYNTT